MKKSASQANAKSSPSKKSGSPPEEWRRPPLRPRKKLFVTLMFVYVLWVIALLTMYFTTVYPHRHPSHSTSTSKT